MIKFGEKDWSDLSDEQKVSYCKDNLVEPAKSELRKNHLQWYLNTHFLNGKHYAYYNTTTNTIETPPRKKNSIRLTVNKVKSTIRSVMNYSTRFRPKFECIPGDLDEETIKNARRAGKLLDYLHVKLYLRSKVRKLVRNGLVTSVGFWELDWDEDAVDGEGEVSVTNHDPFDIFLPSTARLEGPVIHAPFVTKVITRNLSEVRNDDRYDEEQRKEVEPDDELAYSTQKAKLLRKSGQKKDRKEGQETVTVFEVMVYDPEGNDKGGNIQLVTFADDKLLRDEALEAEEFPIYCFQADNSTPLVFSTSWVENLIPLNKGLDRLESQIMEYNNKMLRPRIIADKGHGVNLAATGRVDDEIEVIEKAPNRVFEPMPLPALPTTIHRQVESLNRYIEDVGGAHEASLGSLPQGARSGKTLEALQAADSNNLAGIRESLEDFLSVIGSRMLDIVADKYQTSRVIKISEPEEGQSPEAPYMEVIGSEAGNEPREAAIINKNNEVQVKIGSWLGYTREAQRETLIELGSAGFIPREEVLRQFEFPNIEELSAKAREERLEEQEMKADIAGRRGQQGGGQPQRAAGGGDMLALADEENARMMNGEQVPPTSNATPDHTQAHISFLQSADVQNRPQTAQIIAMHAQGETQQMQAEGGAIPA